MLISIDTATTINVEIIYNRLISLFVYPRILFMEMDWAFFSMMILDSKYINTTKIHHTAHGLIQLTADSGQVIDINQ